MHLARIASAQASGLPRPGRFPAETLPRMLLASLALASVLLPAFGCGNQYRPVVTATNPVGPAPQPQKLAIAVAQPAGSANGLLSFIDFSGDTLLTNAFVGQRPYYLNLNSSGGQGYTLNADGTISSFSLATTLQTSEVNTITLVSGANPTSTFSTSTNLYVPESGRSAVAQLQGTPPAVVQELPVNSSFAPVYVVGTLNAARAYAVSQSTAPGAPGQVSGIETATNTISTNIPVGVAPVYGVMTADGKRAFILNRGSNSVSVINAQANQLDVTTPLVPVGTAPVWADLAPTRNELVVANAGDGTGPGSVSLVSIPLCSAAALPTNPNCDPNNPVDAVGFGTVLANIPVGRQPVMVAALQDGSRAYVANYADSTVSVIDLQTNVVIATIPVSGRPIYLAATSGTPTGKVYVVTQDSVAEPGFPLAPTSSLMTVIRTDTDSVETYVDLQGKGISVRVSLP